MPSFHAAPRARARFRPQLVALAAASLCGAAFAQDAAKPADKSPEVKELEAVVVTGTRAKDRTLADTAVPVDVLSRDDVLRAAGADGNLAAALQALLPSFNFPRQSNSGGGDHVRAAQLRGLSPDQVLVLVNGKRRHTSAVVNLESKTGKGTNVRTGTMRTRATKLKYWGDITNLKIKFL